MHVTRLRQDLKHLVIRKEVETGEGSTFSAEVLFQAFLNFVEALVVVLEPLQVYLSFVVGGESKGFR